MNFGKKKHDDGCQEELRELLSALTLLVIETTKFLKAFEPAPKTGNLVLTISKPVPKQSKK